MSRSEAFPPSEDEAATGSLFDLRDEFLAEVKRDSRHRGGLFREYVLWRLSQDSLHLELERFSKSPPPETVGIDEVISALDVDRRGVFDLVAEGKIRLFRVGAEVLFSRSQVEELQLEGQAR